MKLIDADMAKEKLKEFENELFTTDEIITFLDECCPAIMDFLLQSNDGKELYVHIKEDESDA